MPVSGGLERRLPVDRAGLADLSPDGESIAYNRISREDATWKRYQGGEAQDIWVGRLRATATSRASPTGEGADNYPMWQGNAIYFASDREHGTLNLYRLDLGSRTVTALTYYPRLRRQVPLDRTGCRSSSSTQEGSTSSISHRAKPTRSR